MSDKNAPGLVRILVVDDDANTLEILRRWLSNEGYATETAEDGEACLVALAKDPYDIVLLDVMMPGLDGLQVCEKMQASETLRRIPVVLLTAKDDMETRTRGMELGVSEYLTKPINKQELFSRLQAQAHSLELNRRMDKTAAAVADLPEE